GAVVIAVVTMPFEAEKARIDKAEFGLQELPPLLFAGLRYILASLILLGVIVYSKSEYFPILQSQSKRWWGLIFIYGVVFITITMGTQFIGLKLLSGITVS
ncbi:MAG: EamA family transporter, partial [Candidatus Hodarchaeota archaeon]